MRHPVILAGTYHKTGTVWINRVMRDLASAIGVPYFRNALRDRPVDDAPLTAGIYFDDHAIFPEDMSEAGVAGFRMIRDPRDVVISGAHYHVRSPENWLHIPRGNLDGRTYQQAINDLKDTQAQYVFEMNHAGAHTIESMADPNACVGRLHMVRYEVLMADADFSDFRKLAEGLGLENDELDKAVTAFKKHSLVGDARSTGKHGTSGGKLERWKTTFTRATAEAFVARHGDALISLGYEVDHAWVDTCKP